MAADEPLAEHTATAAPAAAGPHGPMLQGGGTTDPATGAHIDADAFKKLYPRQFFDRFFAAGVRPDGRTLGRARPISLGVGAISHGAAGSCLAKLGSTAVLAGVRAVVGEAREDAPGCGTLRVNVELAPFALPDPGGPASQELLAALAHRLTAALAPLRLEQQLGVKGGKAAYALTMDVYVLDADGAELDAALLAAVAALSSTRLPAVKASGDADQQLQDGASSPGKVSPAREGAQRLRLHLPDPPIAVTCALAGTHLLVDPTAEERGVADGRVTAVLGAQGALYGVYKSGGGATAGAMTFTRCLEAAKLRHKEVAQLLAHQLALYEQQQQQQDGQQGGAESGQQEAEDAGMAMAVDQ